MFAYKLALALGIPDVEGMLNSMSSSQLSRWIAYFVYSLNPAAVPDQKITVGKGKLKLEDWKRMDDQQRKQTSSDLIDMFKTWATVQK